MGVIQLRNGDNEMSILVSKSTTDLTDGVNGFVDGMVADYADWTKDCDRNPNWQREQVNQFKEGIEIKDGRSYIKIMANRSVTGFIVKHDNDKKFKRGDILKPISLNSPARNAARGNVLDGNYYVNWTGPLYLK